MKRIVTYAALIGLMAGPVMAEEPNAELKEGLELLGEGARLLLRGLQAEVEPMAEGWGLLVEELGDFSLYHLPEVQPNGDILIRRKEPLTGEEEETDI